jgi:hypothetical protein
MSAAAIADVPTAVKLVQRIAGDERAVRFLALETTGTTGGKLLRRAMFPWNHVASSPQFEAARRALADASARARQQIGIVLGDVTPQ